MELQWPLILFTTFVAWSCGVFATQGVLALQGKAAKVQMPALITSIVLLAIGGIAVFFHLEHWERIFNGFGHLTSGITQELIAIVVLVLAMVVFFAMLRKTNGEKSLPSWTAILAIVVSALLLIVMAHSYMMPARPAWNNVLWIVYVLGNACVMGPATVLLIAVLKGEEGDELGRFTFIGSAVNAVTSLVYAIWLQISGSGLSEVGYYYDPTHPTHGMVDVSQAMGAFLGDSALVMWIGVILIGVVAPLAVSFWAKKKPSASTWKTCAIAVLACAVVGAVCMRIVFYNLGLSVFPLF